MIRTDVMVTFPGTHSNFTFSFAICFDFKPNRPENVKIFRYLK